MYLKIRKFWFLRKFAYVEHDEIVQSDLFFKGKSLSGMRSMLKHCIQFSVFYKVLTIFCLRNSMMEDTLNIL